MSRFLDISRLTLTTPPVIRMTLNYSGSPQQEDYTLCSPWHLESELEPVFWGGSGDLLMLDENYLDPIRGYRFRAKLSTQAIDINDWGILNELRRFSKSFWFYPYGTNRPGWQAYIPGSMHKINRDTPTTTPAEFELLGIEIISVEDSVNLAIILDPVVEKTGSGPWTIKVRWTPVITTGNLYVAVSDGSNTDQAHGPIANGYLQFGTSTLTSDPTSATLTHDKSPYTREVSIL